MMNNIAIFENEIDLVKGCFDAVNFFYYNNSLNFDYFVSSQEFQDYSNIVKYDLVLVDLDLSKRSILDGFGVIREILKIEKHPPIVILTGLHNVKKALKDRELPMFPIITKPIDYELVYSIFSNLPKTS